MPGMQRQGFLRHVHGTECKRKCHRRPNRDEPAFLQGGRAKPSIGRQMEKEPLLIDIKQARINGKAVTEEELMFWRTAGQEGIHAIIFYFQYFSGYAGRARCNPPDGNAFEAYRKTRGALNLYKADKNHPSEAGGYLNACCLYKKIFGRSPCGIAYYDGLGKNNALMMQKIANQCN